MNSPLWVGVNGWSQQVVAGEGLLSEASREGSLWHVDMPSKRWHHLSQWLVTDTLEQIMKFRSSLSPGWWEISEPRGIHYKDQNTGFFLCQTISLIKKTWSDVSGLEHPQWPLNDLEVTTHNIKVINSFVFSEEKWDFRQIFWPFCDTWSWNDTKWIHSLQ